MITWCCREKRKLRERVFLGVLGRKSPSKVQGRSPGRVFVPHAESEAFLLMNAENFDAPEIKKMCKDECCY